MMHCNVQQLCESGCRLRMIQTLQPILEKGLQGAARQETLQGLSEPLKPPLPAMLRETQYHQLRCELVDLCSIISNLL